jgi:hypothetical protein
LTRLTVGLGSRAKTSNSARSGGAATLILAQCQISPVGLCNPTFNSPSTRSSASSRTQFDRDKLLIGDGDEAWMTPPPPVLWELTVCLPAFEQPCGTIPDLSSFLGDWTRCVGPHTQGSTIEFSVFVSVPSYSDDNLFGNNEQQQNITTSPR